MAPEVYKGAPYGASADIYSLGRLISYMKYKAWRWRGIEALDRLEAACADEDVDARPTAEEIVAALDDEARRRRSHHTGGSSGGGGGGGAGHGGGGLLLMKLCCDEGTGEEVVEDDDDEQDKKMDYWAGALAGAPDDVDPGGGGGGWEPNLNVVFSSLSRLKQLGRRVAQTVQYAFFGMVLRPGWFITSMGGGDGRE